MPQRLTRHGVKRSRVGRGAMAAAIVIQPTSATGAEMHWSAEMKLRQNDVRIGLVVAGCFAWLLPSNASAQRDAGPLVRYFEGNAVELPLDSSRVAVFMAEDASGDATREALAPLGFAAADVQPYGV